MSSEESGSDYISDYCEKVPLEWSNTINCGIIVHFPGHLDKEKYPSTWMILGPKYSGDNQIYNQSRFLKHCCALKSRKGNFSLTTLLAKHMAAQATLLHNWLLHLRLPKVHWYVQTVDCPLVSTIHSEKWIYSACWKRVPCFKHHCDLLVPHQCTEIHKSKRCLDPAECVWSKQPRTWGGAKSKKVQLHPFKLHPTDAV